LKSRWSNVAGIPVGFIAAPIYLVLAALSVAAGPRLSGVVTILASAVMSSVIYFVLLQVVVIRAVCPWCMLDHALGMAASFAALMVARRLARRSQAIQKSSPSIQDPFEDDAEDSAPTPGPRASAAGSVAAGVALTMGFVIVQHLAARAPQVARVESSMEAPDGAAGSLKLVLKDGSVTLPAASLPRIGPESAARRLVLLFDYCCPHCREAHNVIRRLHPAAGGQWQVIFVPAPLNSECNPGVEETEERFQDACELARISLAVWKLKPGDWPMFDGWLFEPESPRTAADARTHASALYGELELAEALAELKIDSAVQAGVAAYRASGGRVLPVILSPGSAGIAGRTDSEEELRQILSREFGYPQPAAP
jgi:hypothetical protein